MPAIISVKSNLFSDKEQWIEEPVLRVGSDPNCDVCLPSPDLEDHVLTLEYRDGVYHVHNRSERSFKVDRRQLAPGGEVAWGSGRVIDLADGISLRLAIEGDSAPSPRPQASLLAEYDESGADHEEVDADQTTAASSLEEPGSANAKKLMQLIVIGVCVSLTAAMVTLKGLQGSEETGGSEPSYAAIVKEANGIPGGSHDLLEDFQFAQDCLVRGDRAGARVRLYHLRDELLYREGREEDVSQIERERRDLEQTMLAYVVRQLDRLKK